MGLFAFFAGYVILMGIIRGEIYYPEGYSTSSSEINDPGSTIPPNSLIYQPSNTIFNITMLISGALIGLSAYFLSRAKRDSLFAIPQALFAAGVFGVGLFREKLIRIMGFLHY
jgi:hypothetical membrane protein